MIIILPTPCQKSPPPPFIKGGLGGISEAVRPKKISWQFSRFFILTGHAMNHVLIEQSRKIERQKNEPTSRRKGNDR
jgi:hypothetical protein